MSYTPKQATTINNITNEFITNEFITNNISECDLTEVMELLKLNAECCSINTKYIMDIHNKLSRYELIIKEFLQCFDFTGCGNTGVIIDNPIRPVIPGEIVQPPPTKPVKPIQPKPVKPKPIKEVFTPKRIEGKAVWVDHNDYDTRYYANSNVINIDGMFKIVGDKYVDENGIDLMRYLPMDINITDGELILERILDYRIYTMNDLYRMKNVVLVYQVKNTRTGVVKIFEGGINRFRNWWFIHTNKTKKQPVRSVTYQNGRING